MKQIAYNEQRNPFLQAILTTAIIFMVNMIITALFSSAWIWVGTALSSFLMIPFFGYKMRNLRAEPHDYFLKHPFAIQRPDELYNFQIDIMKKHGVQFELKGELLEGIPIADLPAEIHVDGLVYRYTVQPEGTRYRWNRERDMFWSQHDSYVYVGKIGEVQPQQPLEIVSFGTGFMKHQRWYYIRYNNGMNGGFTLRSLVEACGYYDDFDVEEPEVEELLQQLQSNNAIIEPFRDNRHAVYFDNEENAAKVLEWLNSRYMIQMMIGNRR